MPTRSAPPPPPGPELARGLLGQEACQPRPHFADHPPRPPSCPPPAKSGVCRPGARPPLLSPPISLCGGGDGERRLLGRGTWTAHRVGDIGGGWSGGVGVSVFHMEQRRQGLGLWCSRNVPAWYVACLPRCALGRCALPTFHAGVLLAYHVGPSPRCARTTCCGLTTLCPGHVARAPRSVKPTLVPRNAAPQLVLTPARSVPARECHPDAGKSAEIIRCLARGPVSHGISFLFCNRTFWQYPH